jgi:uracil-DNA glycosylase family 4
VINLLELPSCTRCDLSLTRQRVVVGSGPSDPALLVIGEAPGRSEDEGGEPFIGRSGQLLFRLLEEEIGVTRSQCFVTNVVKCRPPENRTPTTHEITTCRPWLDEQLTKITPKAVLTLGNTAGRAVFGFSESMSAVHGRIMTLGSHRGLPTYHPAAALRGGPSVVNVMRADMQLLRPLLESS